MKILNLVFIFFICTVSHAQGISYQDLVNLDWNDHPFSLAELLTENEYTFHSQEQLDGNLLYPGEQSRESFYQLTYTYVTETDAIGAYLCVDEDRTGNFSHRYPAIKLRYMYQSKKHYEAISDEIKKSCEKSDLDFYQGPNSLKFVLDKELMDGVPSYYILVYRILDDPLED